MQFLSLTLGVALLIVVTLDFIFTTIGAQERTLLSFRLTRLVFRAIRRTAPLGRARWPYLISGPFVMSVLASVWLIGVTLAWTLIFSAVPQAVEAEPGWPDPGWWDELAHVGHLLSTLGAATTVAGQTLWYVAGAIVAVNGMVILTLSVSFTLSTTQTVTRGRAFAAVSEMMDPADPGTFPTLAPWLADLCSSLKSAPFALFYSSRDPRLRLPTALVRFAEDAARGNRFEDYARLLGMLPGFDPDASASRDEFITCLRAWSGDFSLSRGDGGTPAASAARHPLKGAGPGRR